MSRDLGIMLNRFCFINFAFILAEVGCDENDASVGGRDDDECTSMNVASSAGGSGVQPSPSTKILPLYRPLFRSDDTSGRGS